MGLRNEASKAEQALLKILSASCDQHADRLLEATLNAIEATANEHLATTASLAKLPAGLAALRLTSAVAERLACAILARTWPEGPMPDLDRLARTDFAAGEFKRLLNNMARRMTLATRMPHRLTWDINPPPKGGKNGKPILIQPRGGF